MTRRMLFTLPFATSAPAQPDPDLAEIRALIARNGELQHELDASIARLQERVGALEKWGKHYVGGFESERWGKKK